MNGKQKTIWIWVVSLLLVLVMLAAVWYAHQSRQQDWWDGFTETTTTRPDFSGKTVPTEKMDVNVGSLFPEDDTASGTAGENGDTAGEDGDTADTAKTTANTAVTKAGTTVATTQEEDDNAADTAKTTANTVVTKAGTTVATTQEDGNTVTVGSRFDDVVSWGELRP